MLLDALGKLLKGHGKWYSLATVASQTSGHGIQQSKSATHSDHTNLGGPQYLRLARYEWMEIPPLITSLRPSRCCPFHWSRPLPIADVSASPLSTRGYCYPSATQLRDILFHNEANYDTETIPGRLRFLLRVQVISALRKSNPPQASTELNNAVVSKQRDLHYINAR